MSFDSFSDSELYAPDFFVKTRKNGNTMRKTFPYIEFTNLKLEIIRFADDKELVPVTDIDDFFSEFEIFVGKTELTLSKSNKFNDVKDALDMYSTSVASTFDSKTNMEKHIYTVPVVGYVKGQNTEKKTINTNTTNYTDISRKERFIIINDHKYSCDKIYKAQSGIYVPLILPSIDEVSIPDDSQYFLVSKITLNSNTFTFTLPKSFKINGLSLRPESFKYEKIHSTAFKCNQKCKKDKHHIKVLSNNPGFIKSFELSYRSPNTGGKWIDIGKFNGSKSIFSHDLITFDETLMNEFRVNVIEYEGNIEKIRIHPFGKMISSHPIDKISCVTYILYTPRDGHYVKMFEKRSNYIKSNKDSDFLIPHSKAKGMYKKKSHYTHDVYNDTNYY